jgi:hypothetical protein
MILQAAGGTTSNKKDPMRASLRVVRMAFVVGAVTDR